MVTFVKICHEKSFNEGNEVKNAIQIVLLIEIVRTAKL
jgi:hypothetical protein